MPALWGTGKRLSLPSVVTGGECVDCIKYTNTVAQTGGPRSLGLGSSSVEKKRREAG
jgi:hypothetical protein